MITEPSAGSKAQDFTLPGVRCAEFTLSSKVKEGPVLLYFYPTDYGLMCTFYGERLNEAYDGLTDAGVTMYAISPNDISSHIGWMKRINSVYDHLSDVDQKVSKMYGMLVSESYELVPFNNRGFALIDGDMMIRYIWRAEIAADIIDPEVLVEKVRDALKGNGVLPSE